MAPDFQDPAWTRLEMLENGADSDMAAMPKGVGEGQERRRHAITGIVGKPWDLVSNPSANDTGEGQPRDPDHAGSSKYTGLRIKAVHQATYRQICKQVFASQSGKPAACDRSRRTRYRIDLNFSMTDLPSAPARSSHSEVIVAPICSRSAFN